MRRKLKKREDIEARENRMLRLLKEQKVPFRIEDVPKPPLIRARRVTPPAKVPRTELRKLEEEVLKKTTQTADAGYPVYRFDVGRKRVFIRGKDGKFRPYPITKELMKKFRKAMKDIENEIGKEERKKLR